MTSVFCDNQTNDMYLTAFLEPAWTDYYFRMPCWLGYTHQLEEMQDIIETSSYSLIAL